MKEKRFTMKEEEVRQLENYYNCLIEQKIIAAKLTEEANVSYYNDKKTERDSIKNKYDSELNLKKESLKKLSLQFEESSVKLQKSDLNLGEDFLIPETTEQLLKILKSKRADSIKEALNIYYLDKRLDEIEETLDIQKTELQSAKNLANAAMVKANESYNLAEAAYQKADDAYRKADEAYNAID